MVLFGIIFFFNLCSIFLFDENFFYFLLWLIFVLPDVFNKEHNIVYQYSRIVQYPMMPLLYFLLQTKVVVLNIWRNFLGLLYVSLISPNIFVCLYNLYYFRSTLKVELNVYNFFRYFVRCFVFKTNLSSMLISVR